MAPSPAIARTAATGAAMLPELVAWSSSYADDRALVREDLLGSAAHVTMLGRTGLVGKDDARALRGALLALFDEASAGGASLPDGEEDIHMAVEAELAARLGAPAQKLHTARSRNDQIALDLRLHVRAHAAATLAEVSALARQYEARAAGELDVLLPAYTHRQRAQPVSAAFVLCAWAIQLLRAADTVRFCLDAVDELPLGAGACSGSSLPIDRPLVARLLGFPRLSDNALDTVGNRDFALDWTWAAARVVLALGKTAADLIDMSTTEFGIVTLGGEIASGSSMMPQKKNPDVFELVRGKTARAIGNVTAMLTLVKGLPSGYNRDQQEDRRTLLETGPLARGAVRAMSLALPHLAFDRARGLAALADGFPQATDLAEALVKRGVPFRESYRAVGALVRTAIDDGVGLGAVDAKKARAIHEAFDEAAFRALDPATAVAAKEIPGGTGPGAVDAQRATIRARADELTLRARAVPTLEQLRERIANEAP